MLRVQSMMLLVNALGFQLPLWPHLAVQAVGLAVSLASTGWVPTLPA
jgi:hypothetical protein